LGNDSNVVPFPIKKGGGSPMNQNDGGTTRGKIVEGENQHKYNPPSSHLKSFYERKRKKGGYITSIPFHPYKRSLPSTCIQRLV
jgi:hypothetical protein